MGLVERSVAGDESYVGLDSWYVGLKLIAQQHEVELKRNKHLQI